MADLPIEFHADAPGRNDKALLRFAQTIPTLM
jgi:hypothetical protein